MLTDEKKAEFRDTVGRVALSYDMVLGEEPETALDDTTATA